MLNELHYLSQQVLFICNLQTRGGYKALFI